MDFDYSALRGKIVEKCRYQRIFAQRIGLAERTVSLKMSNERSWTQPEIVKACGILGIDLKDIPEYFFKEDVPQCASGGG